VILEGADAVLSGLGSRSAAEAGVATRGTQSIIQAMNENGVRRIVVVSAAPISTVSSPGRPRPPKFDPGDAFVMRYILGPIIKTVLRKHYADLAIMEDKLRESNLDWTIVRPPQLNDAALTRVYRTALGQNLPRGMLISRADVAHLMLRALEQPETIRQTVGIAY
jgi:putative NADH-flavin reductase